LKQFWTSPSKYKSFFIWLCENNFKKTLSSEQTFELDFGEHLIELVINETYELYLDWALPYICFSEKYKVGVFKGVRGKDWFYPFHNFQPHGYGQGTTITVREKDHNYTHSNIIRLKQTNYSLFAYWFILIQKVEILRWESLKALEPYFQYINNLGAIESVFLNYGPLSKMTPSQIEKMIHDPNFEWTGHVSNTWFDSWKVEHIYQLAHGLLDIVALKHFFTAVIKKETITGRNANRTVQIEYLAHLLLELWSGAEFRKLFDELWAFNQDIFGYDLYNLKTHQIVSQSKEADIVYKSFMKENLFEHSIIDNPTHGYETNSPDPFHWANQAYRTSNTLHEFIMFYYHVRQGLISAKNASILQREILPKTPSSGNLHAWVITEKSLDSSPGLAGHGTPSQLYQEWRLNDKEIRKLANYLLRGNKLDDIKAVEADIVKGIRDIIGNRSFREVPFDEFDKIHEMALDVKKKFLLRNNIDIKRPGKFESAAVVLNIVIAAISIHHAHDSDWSPEETLGACSAILAASTDIGVFVGKIYAIEATLSRSALQAIPKLGIRYLSMGLGTAKLIAGGAGGIIGIVWCSLDSGKGYLKGYRKDATLDAISAVGCAITTVGLFLDATVVGAVPGIACNILGFLILICAQAAKYFRWWSEELEDYCKRLYCESLEDGGMKRLEFWENEYEEAKVLWPPEMFKGWKELEEFIERVDTFLVDMDTYDLFKKEL